MIRILHMFLGNTKGGRTQYMLNTWANIDHNRFHFDFLTLCDFLDYEEDLKKTGASVYHISCYAEDDPQQFEKEITDVLRNGYDAVHVHFAFWRGFLIEECAKKVGIPKVILHSHNNGISMVSSESEAKELEKQHYRLRELLRTDMATHFLACSTAAAKWMYADLIPPEMIRVVKNGIDIKRYSYDEGTRARKRKELSIGSKYIIGCIAKFVYQKNHDFLIDVFSEVAEQSDNVLLLLAGVGELQTVIEKKVDNLRLSDKVKFLGKRDDVAELMQAMDLFVLPSRFEGFPLSLIEAQAAALPCVVGSVPVESCFSERAHRLPLDREIWVKTILSEMMQNSRNHVPEKIISQYDICNQIPVLEEIYES